MGVTAEELKLLISGDSVDGQRAVQQIADALSNGLSKALKDVNTTSDQSKTKTGELKKFIDDLTPSTKNAGAAFTDLKGTLSDMWDNPTGKVRELATALASDMTPALGGAAIAAGLVAAGVIAASAVVYELASRAAAAGANLNDMGEKTGIAVPILSRWANAAKVAGTDIESLSNAVFMMQKNMAESPDKFEKGLERIGLHFAEFKRLEPDQQLLAIANGLKAAEDPAVRTAAGVETLGRSARDMIPSLLKLNEALEQTADIRPWSDEEARQAEAFEMKVEGIKVHAEALAMELGRNLIPAVSTLVGWFRDGVPAVAEWLGHATRLLPLWQTLSAVWGFSATALEVLRGKAVELPITLEEIEKRTKTLADANADLANRGLKPAAAGSSELFKAEQDLTSQAQTSIEANKKRKDATDKYNVSLGNVLAAESGLQGVLDELNGTVVEAIKHDLEQGAAVEDVARVYGVAAAKVRILEKAVKDEAEAAKKSAKDQKETADILDRMHKQTYELAMKAEKDFRDEQARLLKKSNDDTADSIRKTGILWDEYYDAIDRETLSTTDYQIKQVDRWFQDEVAKLQDDDAAWGLHYDALYAKAEQNKQHILDLNDPFKRAQKAAQDQLKADWDHFLDDIAGGFTRTFSVDIVDVLFGDKGFKDVWHDLGEMLKTDLKAILADILNNIIQGFVSAAAAKLGGFLAGLVGLGKGGGGGFWAGLLGALIPGLGGGDAPIGSGAWTQDPNTGIWSQNPSVPGMDFQPPDPPRDDRPGVIHESIGGVVYAALGRTINFKPSGTDTVPAITPSGQGYMLTPGEGIVNLNAMRSLGADGLSWLNHGGNFSDLLAGNRFGGAGALTLARGDTYLQFMLPPGTNVNDPQALSTGMLRVMREDTNFVFTAIQKEIDRRLAAAT